MVLDSVNSKKKMSIPQIYSSSNIDRVSVIGKEFTVYTRLKKHYRRIFCKLGASLNYTYSCTPT